jgi:hypothetical protein
MSEGEKGLDAKTFIMPVPDIDTLTIEALLVLTRPVVIRWVVLQADRERGLAIISQQLDLNSRMEEIVGNSPEACHLGLQSQKVHPLMHFQPPDLDTMLEV